MESRLSKDERLSAVILDTIAAVVCVMGVDGRIVLFNRASQELTGYTEAEVLQKYPWDLFILPEEISKVKAVFKSLTLGHFPNKHTNYWKTKSGELRLIAWSNTALADETGNLAYIIATGIDITEQKKAEDEIIAHQKNLEDLVTSRTAELQEANKKLEFLVNHDELTDLFNRRHFNDALDTEIRRARRLQIPLSLLFCDVDYFKNYNDTYGHIAGDNCLQIIATIMKKHFQRASDLIARYGGEEFCVILPGIDTNQAWSLSESLLTQISKRQIKHTSSPIADIVTISIGLVTCLDTIKCDAMSLLKMADQALYAAKNNGRNRIESIQFP